MKIFAIIAVLASLAGLTGCATQEQVSDQATATASAKPSYASALTGTRIPSRGTSQSLSTTEGSTYDRDSRGKASPVEFH